MYTYIYIYIYIWPPPGGWKPPAGPPLRLQRREPAAGVRETSLREIMFEMSYIEKHDV